MKQLNIIDLNVEIWILILCPILVVIFIMIKKLSSLAWVSTIANCFIAFGILSIFVHLIRNAGNPLELPKFSSWSVFPLFFGIAVFAFEAIPVVSISLYLIIMQYTSIFELERRLSRLHGSRGDIYLIIYISQYMYDIINKQITFSRASVP